MFSLYVLPVIAQAIVPLTLLGWLAFGARCNRVERVSRILAIGAYLIAIALAGLWLIVPWPLSIVYLLVFTVVGARSLARIGRLSWWPQKWQQWLSMALSMILLAISVWLIGLAWAGRRPAAGQIVDLAFPLSDGTYYVTGGGGNEFINPHLQTISAERFRNYRGQSYGVDIVKFNRLGVHASTPAPGDPRRYVIFGDPIHAPCSGTVLRAEDGFPDMSPPQPDRAHMAGNYVFLECGETQVLLGHVQSGTIRVRPGEHVDTGDVIGNVGNSGNTGEPHLHIHAQRPAAGDAFLSGDPLPIRLDGRFLVRNSRLRATPSGARATTPHGADGR